MTVSKSSSIHSSQERPVGALNGALMLAVNIALIVAGVVLLIRGIQVSEASREFTYFLLAGLLLQIIGCVMLVGHFTLQPNEARVLILFGSYHGTVRESGFHWANPFYSRIRARIPRTGGDSAHQNSSVRREAGVLCNAGYRTLPAKLSL